VVGVVRVVPQIWRWNAVYLGAPFWDTTDLSSLVGQHALPSHMCADNTQIYGACRKQFVGRLDECFADVSSWMFFNCLRLNANKTEFLCFASPMLNSPPNTKH
jgi:hypothetical protein